MISLAPRDGRPLRIGHRGAALLAPENTLASFRAAAETGVDLIEFDVIRHGGQLVVAHDSEDVGPETPSLDDALRFFVERCSPDAIPYNFSQDEGYGALAMRLAGPIEFTELETTGDELNLGLR